MISRRGTPTTALALEQSQKTLPPRRKSTSFPLDVLFGPTSIILFDFIFSMTFDVYCPNHRLWLESDFSSGKTMYATGVPEGVVTEFKVSRVEVWGCGNSDDLGAQERERLRDHQAAEQRQKVKLSFARLMCPSISPKCLTPISRHLFLA